MALFYFLLPIFSFVWDLRSQIRNGAELLAERIDPVWLRRAFSVRRFQSLQE